MILECNRSLVFKENKASFTQTHEDVTTLNGNQRV